MSANPPEHPFESRPAFDGPENPVQSILDIHLDGLAATFTSQGFDVRSIVISVRCADGTNLDGAENDVANGFRVSGAHLGRELTDYEIGEAIMAHVTRLSRSVRRAFTPELR